RHQSTVDDGNTCSPPDIAKAITGMLAGAGAIRDGDLDPLSGTAILTCVVVTEVYAEDEQGGQDWWWGRWHPFGLVAPSDELELLHRAGNAEHHYLLAPDVRGAVTDMLVRKRGLRPGQILRASAVVTHLEWYGRTDVRTD